MTNGLGEQVTPAGSPAAGQVTFTFPVKPGDVASGAALIAEVPLAPAIAVTDVPVMENVPMVPPPIVPVKLKFKTLLPPKAMGFSCGGPNELTIM